jgi:hypothetical protein
MCVVATCRSLYHFSPACRPAAGETAGEVAGEPDREPVQEAVRAVARETTRELAQGVTREVQWLSSLRFGKGRRSSSTSSSRPTKPSSVGSWGPWEVDDIVNEFAWRWTLERLEPEAGYPVTISNYSDSETPSATTSM